MIDRGLSRAGFLAACVLLITSSLTSAQDSDLIAGQNINMVSGTEWPNGDPFLQRQNEPTIGVSTRNELHLLGGSNDYRTVDLPGLPEGKTTGDSWLSVYESYDGGGRWDSTLLPGYPQDTSAEGLASPLKIAGYEASADPVIRPGTHGLFYYSGIAFTRGDEPPSAGFVATYIDLNNNERGDTIRYLRTTLFDQNADGTSFIDKPWIAVDKPRGAVPTIIQVETENGPISQTVECGNLYAAWARIQGEGNSATSSQILFARSEDCGETFSTPIELTGPGTINQGAYVAVDPTSGRVQVAWRQFENVALLQCTNPARFWRDNVESWPIDQIELAGITITREDGNVMIDPGDDADDDAHDGYGKWKKRIPRRVFRQYLAAWLNVLAGAGAADIQDTLDDAEAWLLENPLGSKPNYWERWQGRKIRNKLRRFNRGVTGPGACEDFAQDDTGPTNPNAIMVSYSDDFGENFSTPVNVSGPNYFPFEQGTTEYSFRSTGYPSMVFDGTGRSYVTWTTRGLAVPDFDEIGGDGRIVVTTSNDGDNWSFPLPIDEPEVRGHQLMPALEYARGQVFLLYYDFREDVSGRFDRFVTDLPVDLTTPRHSVDVRAAVASVGDTPVFTDYSVLDNPSTQTSRYPFVIVSDESSNPVSAQTQYNPPNLPMFQGGLVPFFGDFIDLAALHFVRDEFGVWDFDTDPSRGAPIVHAVWTDNRDVVPPLDGDWTSYVPPGGDGSPSIFDPSQTVPVCTPGTADIDRTKMRNQNIYTSRLTQGLAVAVPGNNRPLGTIQRAFVGFVQNLTDVDRNFRLEILNQPIGGLASFDQFAPDPVSEQLVEGQSSISLSIFVTSTDPSASVDILVTEIDGSGVPIPGGLIAKTRINSDPSAPVPDEGNILAEEVYTPAIFNPAIFNPAIFNQSLLGTGDVGIYNPAIFNPAIFNTPEDATLAALQQASLLNPAIFNPAIFNTAVLTPAIFNPAIFNPAIFNSAVLTPAIFNPAIFNVSTATPAIFNPAIFNPAIFNTTLVETSVVIENQGNATAAYSLNLDLESPPDGFLFQVMVYRTYVVPAVEGCELTQEVVQQQLVSELTPDVTGSLFNPDASTFFIPPDDEVVVTVRIVPDPNNPGDPTTIDELDELNLSQSVTPTAVDTPSLDEGEIEPEPVVILAPSVPPIVIDPTPLPNGASGVAYAVTLSSTGGNGTPITWTVVPSTTLPPGLSLTAAGQIVGTPTTAGTFNFEVRAADDVQVSEQSFAITVTGGGTTGPVVDQSQPNIDQGAGTTTAIGGSSDQKLAQVVRAGLTGSLDEIRIPVACSTGALVIDIQGVDSAGEPNGVTLATETILASAIPAFGVGPDLRPFTFTVPAYFNANDLFAIVLDNPTGSCGLLPAPAGDSYTGGRAFFQALPNPVGVWVELFSPLRDLTFETVVTEIPLYTFQFSNVLGTTNGTVSGKIRFDFIDSLTDSGTGAASDIRITQASPGSGGFLFPPEGFRTTDWSTQAANSFTIVNGSIVDYQFGSSEGATPTASDVVLCLNNGPFFSVGGVYVCTENENYYGDGSSFIYNDDGIAGVTFGTEPPPPPGSSYRWRADFDFSGVLPASPHVCIRNQYVYSNILELGGSMEVTVFDTDGGPIIGQETYRGFGVNNLGDEIFLSGTGLADGVGYLELRFSQPIALQSIDIEGRQGQCIGGGETGFVPATLTPLP